MQAFRHRSVRKAGALTLFIRFRSRPPIHHFVHGTFAWNNAAMPALTRRRNDNLNQETWHIYSGDIRIGSINMLVGVPFHGDQLGWSLGFHPGMDHARRDIYGGKAATFEDARAAFEARGSWSSRRLPRQTTKSAAAIDGTVFKYRMRAEHCLMPTQTQDGRSRCFCGEVITTGGIDDHIQAAHRGIGARSTSRPAPTPTRKPPRASSLSSPPA